jgi:hypothetical protein
VNIHLVTLVFLVPACDFLRVLLNHFKIEFIHLNSNSILHIVVFVHLCAYLAVLPNFELFKHYSFLKYQPSATKRQVIGGIGIQAWAHQNFLDLPLKTSLKGWHTRWFYRENHEPSLPPFVSRLLEYDRLWVEEPTGAEIPVMQALANRVRELKRLSLIRVGVVANWLARRVVPFKKQVHPGWEYCEVQDPTRDSGENIELAKLTDLLKEMFQNTNSWSTREQVCAFYIQTARDPVR